MRAGAPFQPDDLAELDDRLLSRAAGVVALREVHAGNRDPRVIQMRHDVDDNPGAFDCALRLAEWEAARGYRSTYYLLHTASYWGTANFGTFARTIASWGHEVGIHADALAHCVLHGGDPHAVLTEAVRELRAAGVEVVSVVGHGNRACQRFKFANDEQFVECERRMYGPPTRIIHGPHAIALRPRPLAGYGLAFEAVRLGRAYQLSDSGGNWSATPFEQSVARFPDPGGQLHFLMHPDWWTEAV